MAIRVLKYRTDEFKKKIRQFYIRYHPKKQMY